MTMKFLILFSFIALAQASLLKPKNLDELSKIFPQFASRIVGGEEAALNQFPYQAALFFDDGTFCGGSIVGTRTILTSAGCVDGSTSVQVVVGALRVHDTTPSPNFIPATEFEINPNWDPWTRNNDVALVYLEAALTYTDAVQRIELFDAVNNLDSVIGTVSGWGRVTDSSVYSPVLLYASAEIISNNDCQNSFSADVIQETKLCLNGQAGKSPCTGDIGGPLAIVQNDITTLAGIASFGSAWGCSIGYPSVYSRVSSYADWIRTNTRE